MARKTRVRIGIECSECGSRNYSLTKSRDSVPRQLVLRKYCPHCRRHTEHRLSK